MLAIRRIKLPMAFVLCLGTLSPMRAHEIGYLFSEPNCQIFLATGGEEYFQSLSLHRQHSALTESERRELARRNVRLGWIRSVHEQNTKRSYLLSKLVTEQTGKLDELIELANVERRVPEAQQLVDRFHRYRRDIQRARDAGDEAKAEALEREEYHRLYPKLSGDPCIEWEFGQAPVAHLLPPDIETLQARNLLGEWPEDVFYTRELAIATDVAYVALAFVGDLRLNALDKLAKSVPLNRKMNKEDLPALKAF